MRVERTSRYPKVVFGVALWAVATAANAQIMSNEGDGMLNAPYRGTINSLRVCTMAVGFGEVKTHVESLDEDFPITSSTIEIWAGGVWDRSVLRLFKEVDASGDEIDLTDTSASSFVTVPTGINGFNRFSLKAIGTNTLGVQTFTITFHYEIAGGTEIHSTQTFRVAPVTGSFCSLPGESEAFHFGTPILDVSVGNARLMVPIGRTAEMIGAAYSNRRIGLGPAYLIETSNVVLPGAGESVYIQNSGQFRLGGHAEGPDKTDYGTPWPGYLVGYQNAGEVYAPDGTHYDTPWSIDDGLFRFNYIRPFGLSESQPATQVYTYDNGIDNRVTRISDRATMPNVITLHRTAGVVTQVTTSDGRGWAIGSDPVDGWITSVVPDGGKGARHFRYTASPADPQAAPRVDQVKDADQNVMYEFVYAFDGDGVPTDLLEERRHVDGALQTVIEHEIVDEGLRRRKEYTGSGEFRQFDFAYDSAATPAPLNHRLASITSYSDVNGTGTPYQTVYTHDVGNPHGNMVITQVSLPDGTTLGYEYDSHVGAGSADFGFRTKTTHVGPNDGSLATYDVDYEFLYSYSSTWRLFPLPRIVKQRDGRGTISEVTFDYEDGGEDENYDGLNGERSNQLFSRTGPTITQGVSGTRTPETRFIYDTTNRVLERQETEYASGLFRAVEFGYDELLRLTSQTVDPGGENLITQYLHCDADATQDRITVDADGYWTATRYDNDGRVMSVKRHLTANAGDVGQPCTDPTGSFYETAFIHDINGRLYQRIEDNKDQDGNALSPATITSQSTYDRLGRLTLAVVDPGGIGQESNFNYNWLGEVEREFDTSGRGMERAYDGRGLVESETPLKYDGSDDGTPETNLTTTFAHDTLGRLRFTYPPTYPAGASEERVYDEFGRLERIKRVPGSDGGNLITTTFEYDEADNVTRTVVEEAGIGVLSDSTAKCDEGGFNYESRQRAVAGADNSTDPVAQRKFDWSGNVTEERSLGDPTVSDRVLTTVYDNAGRVEEVTDSEGGEIVYTRDGRGNITQQEIKLNATGWAFTNTDYDALSRAIHITGPEDSTGGRPDRVRKCDSRGNLLCGTLRDAANTPRIRTVFAYDTAGRRPRRAVLANASAGTAAGDADVTADRVVDYEYDTDGLLRFRKTYNNNATTELVTETTYDSLGRVYQVTDPSTSYTDDAYFTNGRLRRRVVFDGVGGRAFLFAYDGHDRVIRQIALGSPNLVTSFELDGLDRPLVVTDPKGIKTKTEYDLLSRRGKLIEDYQGTLERETLFAYDRLSRLIEQTAKNKANDGTPLADQVTTYRYDSLSRQTRVVYPDADAANHTSPETCTDCVRMEYDLAGRMTERADQRGLVTTFTHDDRSRLLTRTTGAERDTFDYDAAGRMTLAQRGTTADPDAASRSAMGYTDLGHLDYETQTIAGGTPRTVGYDHDQAGNRIQLDYPSGEVLACTPTVVNQVGTIDLNGSPLFVDYRYNGRLLDKRLTTTDDPGGNTSYEYQVSYDGHRRINTMANSLETPFRGTEAIAAYTFTHDANGNPLTQATTGMADFAGDDRAFTVDQLDRLTGTGYQETGTTEESIFDLVGNREEHTNRANDTTAYGPANEANEYADIAGNPVEYDEAGNLSVDEDSRQYTYDEQNRLIQIRAADDTVLANYTYDALGRRISFEDPVAGLATHYYYAGQSVIEERDAFDVLVRYHVNGAQYLDERVATFDDSTGEFSYYLVNQNFSIAGTGNADGSQIERLDYSSGGDFAGSGGGPGEAYAHDADGDDDVDLADFADFQACFISPDAACLAVHDFDTAGQSDEVIDLADYEGFHECFGGPGVTPSGGEGHDAEPDDDVDLADFAAFQSCFGDSSPDCLAVFDFDAEGQSDGSIDLADLTGFEHRLRGPNVPPAGGCPTIPQARASGRNNDNLPPSGTFALHGRPVDVLSDDHVLFYIRARYYDPQHSRWLQRDPLAYTDGSNLYEAFASNATANSDPMGRTTRDTIWRYIHKEQPGLYAQISFLQDMGVPIQVTKDASYEQKQYHWMRPFSGGKWYRESIAGEFQVGARTIRFARGQEDSAVVAQIAEAVQAQWMLKFWDEHEHGAAWSLVELALPLEDFHKALVYEQAGMAEQAVGQAAMGALKTGFAVLGAVEGGIAVRSFLRMYVVNRRKVFVRIVGHATAPELTAVAGGGSLAKPVVGISRARLGAAPEIGDFLAAGLDRTQAEHILGLLRSSRPVYNMARSPATGAGRLGGPAHRAKVEQVVRELKRRGWTIIGGGGIEPEKLIKVSWRARGRFSDITAEKGGRILRIQVGRQTKGGLPVARERRALQDIRSVQGAGEHTIFIEFE
ncbi:MAG: hypothetical protein KAV82_13275 [Phycisphaerae bacterium]|nr:hypothetical protein [Phycisphaerae bacterium]